MVTQSTRLSGRCAQRSRALTLMLGSLMGTTALFGLPSQAYAQSVWDGSESSDWFNEDNWAGALVPLNSDDVLIDNSAFNPVTISGNPAVSRYLTIGDVNSASLQIVGGGALSSAQGAKLAKAPSAVATVTVSGMGSKWTNPSDLIIGDGGKATLDILGGAAVTSGGITAIGNAGSADGLVTMSGKDANGVASSWNVTAILTVGNAAKGSLIISDGGKVTSQGATVSNAAGSAGSVTISGVDSNWTITQSKAFIASGGSASLLVSDGGSLATNQGAVLSSIGGITATATVAGMGSKWTNPSDLIVGDAGKATLDILGGAAVTSGGIAAIGNAGSADGIVTVSGKDANGVASSWNVTAILTVGNAAKGSLIISDGGKVTSQGATVSNAAGSAGSVTISGVDSNWTITQSKAFIASGRSASLLVSDGGSLATNQGAVLSFIGGITATATVAGMGSKWTNPSDLIIGDGGKATLDIFGGAAVTSGGITAIGNAGSADGKVKVSGKDASGVASSWNVTTNLTVGNAAKGSLVIADGAVVAAPFAQIGMSSGSTGILTIGGVVEGGVPQAAAGAGALNTPTLTFGSGTGTLNFNHTAAASDNYQFTSAIMGDAGTINHYAGVTHLTGDSDVFGGTTNVIGGTLLVDGQLGKVVQVQSGGTLGGMGTITGGADVVAGGALQGFTGQTLKIGTLALHDGANVDVTLGMTGNAALFDIAGDLSLAGTLNVSSAPGFGPGIYTLMTYGGAATGTLAIGGVPPGMEIEGYHVVLTDPAMEKKVNLVNDGLVTLAFWDGANTTANGSVDGGDGAWTATGTNWTTFDGTTNGAMDPQPGYAVFQGDSGTVVVDDSAGAIAIKGAQFYTTGYVVEGDSIALAAPSAANNFAGIRVGDGTVSSAGSEALILSNLTGTAGLDKQDYGTLILAGTNTYAGGTQVSKGTLQVGNGGPTGSIAGDVANSGVLRFARSDAYTFAGAVSGSGSLEQSGSGTLILTGANSYAGGTKVTSGNLEIGNGGTSGAIIGDVVLAAGTNLRFNRSDSLGFAGTLSGTGELQQIGSGTTNLTGDSGAFDGALTVAAGTLGLSGGGKLRTAGATLGLGTASSGTVKVDSGAAWTSNGMLLLGASDGAGTLAIASGGAVTSANTVIGSSAGSAGTVSVDGAGSRWTNTGQLRIADLGTGTLAVTGAGSVKTAGATLGADTGSTGKASIDGAGSAWTDTGVVYVGGAGTGTLDLLNAGKMTLAEMHVGDQASGDGSVSIKGAGASLAGTGLVAVGYQGKGDLAVADGGTLSTGLGAVGYLANSQGSVTVAGAGSKWTSMGQVDIGASGTGALTLTGGGALASAAPVVLAFTAEGDGTLNIGGAAGSAAAAAGTLSATQLVMGAGSAKLNFNHDSTAVPYVFITAISGAGTIAHAAGYTELTGDSSGFAGVTALGGGRIDVTGALGGQINIAQGATLGGSGSVGMVDVAAGGTLAGVQGDALTLAGLTLGDGANVNVVLYEPGTTALFDVTGNLRLDGVLNITGAFGPGLYTLMTAGSIDDQGLEIGSVPAGSTAGAFDIQVLDDAGMAVKQVNLVSAADVSLLFWDGAGPANDGVIQGGNGTWSIGGTNWTDSAGAANGPMNPQPGFAVFGGTGGAVTVDGQVGVLGLQFASDGYVLSGGNILLVDEDGSLFRVGAGSTGADWKATIGSKLTGAGGVIKTDPGTLILTGNNDYTGPTIVQQGTLQVSGGGKLTGAGNGTIAGISGTTANAKVDGAGSVWNAGQLLVGTTAGAGTLAVTNGGTVTTQVAVIGSGASSNGTASVDGAGSAWTNAGIVYVGNGGAGALTLSNGGKLTAELNLGEGGTGVLNIGGAKGAAAAAAGTLAGDVTFGTGGTGEVNFNHNAAATAYAFDSKLSGAGTINNVAGNTSLTADSSGFTGVANVLGGRLAVNGKLGGAVNVATGGTLGGNGTIGSLSVASGGVVAPGNSIGTLSVTGNASFASGSTYAVELTGGTPTSDLIKVGGTATIADGAKLTVTKVGDAPYQVGAHYTVLTAAGGVTGNFLLDNPTQFIGLKLGKDANNVYLDLIKAKAFADAGITFNQKATGAALDLLPFEGALVSALASMQTDAQVQGALDQLSGEAHASARTILVEDSRFVRDAALARLRSAFDGVAAGDIQAMAYGEDGTLHAVEANPEGIAWWSQGFGSWGSFSGDGNAAGLTRDTSGFLTGFDMGAGDQVRAGLTGGYSHTGAAIDGRASSIKSENYHFGLYAGAQLGRFSLRGGLSYSWHDVDVDRSVAFTGFSDKLSTDYHGNTSQAFLEAGYGIETGAFSLEPYAGIAHALVTTDAAQEKGGAAALKLADATTGVTWTTLGLRTAQHFDLGNVQMSTRASLGWRHALEDVTPLQGQSLAGSPGFAVAGLPAGRDSLSIEAGLDARVSDRFSLGVSYIGQHSARAQDHGVKGTMRLAF